jgi:hypothetical protein
VRGLIDFVEELRVKGVDFRSITQGIDATTSGGRFFSHVLAALAQMERGLIGAYPDRDAAHFPQPYLSPVLKHISFSSKI